MGNYYRVLVYDGSTSEEINRLTETAKKEKYEYPNTSVFVGKRDGVTKFMALIPLSEMPEELGPEPWQDTTDLVQEHFLCEFNSEFSTANHPGGATSITYKELNVEGSNGEMTSIIEKLMK